MEVYVHIPFCKRKCQYCDFASCSGREERMGPYCLAMKQEIEMRARQYGPIPLSSVYIGGGTPSVLPPELLAVVLGCLLDHFPLMKDAEVTCEINPGTLTDEFLKMLSQYGVNRLSLGVQARQETLLQTLGRIHSWSEVEDSVSMIRGAGFSNLNLDLMFGLPGQKRGDWIETLEAAIALHPQHLSCYGLILEEGTPIHTRVMAGELSMPEDETERLMYDDALHLLYKAGYEHYEISNFAMTGYQCRHNLGYWQGACYLGFGAAAHSRMKSSFSENAYVRFGNTENLDKYLECLGKSTLPVDEYLEISLRDAEFETLMMGLRVLRGVRESDFLKRHGRTITEAFGGKIGTLIKKGLLTFGDGRLMLTRRGMDVQNTVLVELMDD